MTIRKGEQWGWTGELDPSWPTFGDDRGAARYVSDLMSSGPTRGVDVPTIRLAGGDLFRSVGSPRMEAGLVRIVPVDAVRVRYDGGEDLAVAHVIARRPLWRGEFLVAMNATHVGILDLGPRAHPNDALIDMTEGRLGMRERINARRRARSGLHLPHPQLRTSRVDEIDRTFARPMPLHVDGCEIGATRSLRLDVVPDAFRVAI